MDVLEEILRKIKSFCAEYDHIYIYSQSYYIMHTNGILRRNGVITSGLVGKKDGGIYSGFEMRSIDCVLLNDNNCGIIVVMNDVEKKKIQEKYGSNNFLYIKPEIMVQLITRSKTKDGKIYTYDWRSMTNIEAEWLVKFIRHYFPHLDEKIFLYGANSCSLVSHEYRDGIKIFHSIETLAEIEANPRNPKKTLYSHCLPYVDLSTGYEYINAPNYMQFPYWVSNLCPAGATLQDLKDIVKGINNTRYPITDACACIAAHDWGTRTMVYDNVKDLFDVKFAGRWKKNTDDLYTKYNNNKIDYLKHFCFNICAENVSSEGYCTEKLIDAFKSDAIPLYYGDMNRPYPKVFNQNTIIFFEPNSDNVESRQLIIDLMTNKKLYNEFIQQKKIIPSSVEWIYEHYIMGLYKRLEYLIKRYKNENRMIRFLGTEHPKKIDYETLDCITNHTIVEKDTQYNYFLYDKFLPNRIYNIHMSNIKADFDEFTVGLYDFENKSRIKFEVFLTSGDINFNFETQKDVSKIGLCVYAGKYGETKGKSLTIGNLEVNAISI